MKKKLNLSPWQRFKHALYKNGIDENMAAEHIGTTRMSLRARIYAGLKRPDGKRTPLDKKIVDYIKGYGIDFDTGEQ